jgi:hypothetical protein
MPSKTKAYKSVKVNVKLTKSGELKKPKFALENITAEQLKECKECITMHDCEFHPGLSKEMKQDLWYRMGGDMFNYPKAEARKNFKRFARENVAYELATRKKNEAAIKISKKATKT